MILEKYLRLFISKEYYSCPIIKLPSETKLKIDIFSDNI